MTLSYTDYLISHGTGVVLYPGGGPRAGSNGEPIYACTNATAGPVNGDGQYIKDNTGSWTGVQVGDSICWDTDSARQFNRVQSRDRDEDGNTDTTYIKVEASIAGSGAAWQNKKVNVGGAFGSMQWADTCVASMTTSVPVQRNAANNPVRFNLPSGQTFNECVIFSVAGTTQYPVRWEGYTISPGDIDSDTSSTRTLINPVVKTVQGTGGSATVLSFTTAHNFGIGQVILTSGLNNGWTNGSLTVATIPSTTTITVASGSGSSASTSGSASPVGASQTAVLRIPVGYISAVNIDCQTTIATMHGFIASGSGDHTIIKNGHATATAHGFYVGSNSFCFLERCIAEGCGTIGQAYNGLCIGTEGLCRNSVVTGMIDTTSVGMEVNSYISHVINLLCYGNAGIGVRMANSTGINVLLDCTITDNARDGVSFWTAGNIVTDGISGCIIAHNGTIATGCSVQNTGDTVTIAGPTARYANGTAFQFTAGSPTGANLNTTYFLRQAAGSSPNYTYTIYDTFAHAGTGGATGQIAITGDASSITVAIGYGIAYSGTGGPWVLAVNTYNNIYGNGVGTLQTNGGSSNGTTVVLDNGAHNDSSDAPFSGSSAAARLANGFALTASAKQIHEYSAGSGTVTQIDSYPDLGAMQAIATAGGGETSHTWVK
jgi:hypothetical protein